VAGKPASGAAGQGGAAAGGAGGSVPVTPLVVSAAAPAPRTGTWSVNYWQWTPTWGDDVAGTEALVAALKPSYLRIGGYNNDANTPDPFDHAQIDAMVAYARAIGAEPILQVPVLGDTAGQQPTAQTAAEMVTYANVTKGYGIKYFSVGNEPDIYADQASATAPSRPGYTAADYCTTATAFVAAMKAVDPTIKIVGPDLAWRYQAGNGANDWLTPILQTCGGLLDVVSIHRYPFEAKMATLANARSDAASFRQTITAVRGIMQATGQGAKPLALTEMNVAYDDTACVLGASPGTVGSALWLLDALGASVQQNLWTSAVWDISDTDAWSLGLIGLPPAHEPRPAYYANLLFAEHFGPTLAGVTSAPSGVSAYASRNAAGTGTQIVYANWNSGAAGVQVQVTGLPAAPEPPTFVLPAQSIGAIEVPDTGAATAWAYGEPERAAGVGPQPLPVSGGLLAGVPAGRAVGTNCPVDGGFVCPTTPASSAVITEAGSNGTAGVQFGSGTNTWGSYTYAAPGQTAPVAAATSDGTGVHIQGGFVPPVSAAANYLGFGLYYAGATCLDASAYTGVQFDFGGSLGACGLAFGANFSGDEYSGDDANRGGCQGSQSTCYPPQADVTAQIAGGGAAADGGGGLVVKVPFSKLTAGMPNGSVDPRTIITVQWQLSSPLGGADGGGCTADFTVGNVSFY
jgi:hypothetical protein